MAKTSSKDTGAAVLEVLLSTYTDEIDGAKKALTDQERDLAQMQRDFEKSAQEILKARAALEEKESMVDRLQKSIESLKAQE